LFYYAAAATLASCLIGLLDACSSFFRMCPACNKIISWHQPQENQLEELERGGRGVAY